MGSGGKQLKHEMLEAESLIILPQLPAQLVHWIAMENYIAAMVQIKVIQENFDSSM